MTEMMAIAEDVANQPDKLDRAVDDVFSMMAGLKLIPTTDPVEHNNEVTAVIGLAGSLNGAFIINAREADALRFTEALTRSTVTEFDEIASDTMGEICNMLSGVWKAGFRSLASACLLSVPTVFTGRDPKRLMQSMGTCIERSYLYGQHALTVSILYEGGPH
jgi:chemotaxis protein CheX